MRCDADVLFIAICHCSGRLFITCVFFEFFFQAEDGIRDLVRSRGLGDVYKRQGVIRANTSEELFDWARALAWCPLPAGPDVAVLTLSLIHI